MSHERDPGESVNTHYRMECREIHGLFCLHNTAAANVMPRDEVISSVRRCGSRFASLTITVTTQQWLTVKTLSLLTRDLGARNDTLKRHSPCPLHCSAFNSRPATIWVSFLGVHTVRWIWLESVSSPDPSGLPGGRL